jgi:hypothetical protein
MAIRELLFRLSSKFSGSSPLNFSGMDPPAQLGMSQSGLVALPCSLDRLWLLDKYYSCPAIALSSQEMRALINPFQMMDHHITSFSDRRGLKTIPLMENFPSGKTRVANVQTTTEDYKILQLQPSCTSNGFNHRSIPLTPPSCPSSE